MYAIPIITATVATLDQATKWFCNVILHKNVNKYIPMFSVVFGLIVGIVCWWQFNELLPDNTTWFQSMVIGVTSGSSSTGLHQIEKQLTKSNCDKSDDEYIDCDAGEDMNIGDTGDQEVSSIDDGNL